LNHEVSDDSVEGGTSENEMGEGGFEVIRDERRGGRGKVREFKPLESRAFWNKRLSMQIKADS